MIEMGEAYTVRLTARSAAVSSPASSRAPPTSLVSGHCGVVGANRLTAPRAEGDMRLMFTRFRDPEAFKANLVLVDALKAIAAKKGRTPAELCIAFVASLGPNVIALPGSS